MATVHRSTTPDGLRVTLPVAVRCFNLLVGAAGNVGLRRSLDLDGLLATARKRTGLDDFGDESFLKPLEVLVASAEAEARLSTLGRMAQRARIILLLSNRLRAQDLFKRHPEILQQELPPTVVITGLHRTGTTFLHRLLAADPATRSLKSWEAANPAPLPGEERGEGHVRVRRMLRTERALRYLAPHFYAIHSVHTHATEGEAPLLDLTFMSQSPEAVTRVPSYARWLEEQDHGPAYDYLAKLIKLLHWQRPNTRWVMKTPLHMEHLPELLRAFPNARVINTHRERSRAITSFCSWVYHARSIFSDQVDPHEVGQHWARKADEMNGRAVQARKTLPAGSFLDVHFSDLMDDPMGLVRQIYTFMDWDLSSDAQVAMEDFRNGNRRHKHGRHVYSPEDFGLSVDLGARAATG
jgi:hypothetical protein